jgi:hypothetical protein
LQIWPELHIGTVIKHTKKKRVVEVTRRMAHGVLEQAEVLLLCSQGGMVLNTAITLRFEWHLSRTAGQLDAQISSCGSPSASA